MNSFNGGSKKLERYVRDGTINFNSNLSNAILGVVSVNVQDVPLLLRVPNVLAMIQHDSPLL